MIYKSVVFTQLYTSDRQMAFVNDSFTEYSKRKMYHDIFEEFLNITKKYPDTQFSLGTPTFVTREEQEFGQFDPQGKIYVCIEITALVYMEDK